MTISLSLAENNGRLECPHCHKLLKGTSLRKHLEDMHTVHLTSYECKMCHRHYRTPNSLQNHCSRYHRRQRPDPSPAPAPAPHNLSSLLAVAASARALHVAPGASPRTPGLSNGAPPPPQNHPQAQAQPEKLFSFSDMFN